MAWLIRKNKGFTLVEALFAIAMLLLLSVGSVAANKVATAGVKINQYRSQANFLATEGMEALMSVRVQNFSGLSSGVFHPVFDGANWSLVAGPETLGNFTRTITLSSVMRNLTCFSAVCDIVSAGGIVDTNTFKVEVKIAWIESSKTNNLILDSLITNWR